MARPVSRISELTANGNSRKRVYLSRDIPRHFLDFGPMGEVRSASIRHQGALRRPGQPFYRSQRDFAEWKSLAKWSFLDKLKAWKTRMKNLKADQHPAGCKGTVVNSDWEGSLFRDVTTHHYCAHKLPDQLHFCLT